MADRGEVSYDTWERWASESYVFGPYDSIVCVYGAIEGYDASTGDRETIAFLANSEDDPYDGYWRVVKREVYERFTGDVDRPQFDFLVGQPRSFAHPADEMLPPFSDWSVDVGSEVDSRSIREVHSYRPRPGQLGS